MNISNILCNPVAINGIGRKRLSLILGSAVLVSSSMAAAQDGARADAVTDEQQKGNASLLEHVTVTATRFEQNPIDTPASISVQDMADLRNRGMDSLGDEFRGVPGVFFRRSSEEYATINIRGITGSHGNDTFLALVDGIAMVNADEEVSFADIPYAAVDQVEIVRGPMSTLYGRGAISGVVNYRLRQPETDKTSIALRAGSDGFGRMEGTVERVFGDSNLIASGTYDQADGWRDNSARENANLFVRFQHDFGDDKRLSLYANHLDRTTETSSLLPTLADGTVLEVAGGREGFNGYGNPNTEVRSTLAAVRWEQPLNASTDWTTTLSTRYYNSVSDLNFYDASGFDPEANIMAVNGFYSPNDNRISTLESQLTWQSGRHQVVAGASLENYKVDESTHWRGQYGFTFACGFSFYLIQVDYSSGEVVNGDHPCFEERRLQSANSARSNFAGVFIEDKIALTDQWSLTLGARYDDFDREVEFASTGPFNPGGKLEGSESAVSPKAALSWRYADGQLYLSYGRGFNSNFGPLFEWDPTQYARQEKPTTIDSVELGWKGRALDDRLQFETALFQMVQTNRRVVVSNPDPEGPSSLMSTGRRYESAGLEAAVAWSISDASTLSATYTWLDPEWDEYVTETSEGPLNLSGNAPRGVPSQMLGLDLSHRLSELLALRATYQWNSDYYVNQINTVKTGGFDVLNLYATLTPESLSQVTFELGVLNALDEDYGWYFGNEFESNSFAPAAPRQFRLGAVMEF